MKLVLAKWTADRVVAGILPEWVRARGDELSEGARERPRRNDRFDPRRAFRYRPQHAAHGLGVQDGEETGNWDRTGGYLIGGMD